MAECHWLSAIAGGVLGSATEDARGMVLHGGVLDYQEYRILSECRSRDDA